MDLLFSFLETDRPHCALLAGYFSKVHLDSSTSVVYEKIPLCYVEMLFG